VTISFNIVSIGDLLLHRPIYCHLLLHRPIYCAV
jgi:hypothetical protein